MFWSLFIFNRHSTQEPASIVCNDEQGDLFYSAGPHRNWCQPQPTQQEHRRGFGKNAGEWTRRVEISKKSLAVGVACMAIYGPAPGFKGRTIGLWVLNTWVFNFCIHSTLLLEDRVGL